MTDFPQSPFGNVDDYLRGLNEWVAIESPTDDAAAVNRMISHVEADLVAGGLMVERVPGTAGRGDHLLARAPWRDDASPGILVLCHLDTVHPVGSLAHNPIRTENGRAYGPGISDMKGGAYAAAATLKSLAAAGTPTPLPVTVLYVSDEEAGSETSRGLIEELAQQSKYALVMEPAREGGRIVTARKGVARMTIEVRGRPAHSGNAHRTGRSAVRELAFQVLALEAMTDYERGITVNVGRIEGGTAENVVPEHARAAIDVRVPTDADAERVIARIRSLRPVFPDTEITFGGGLNRAPFRKEARADIGLLFDHAKALAADIGFELRDLPDGEGAGGSDAQFCVPFVPVLDGLGPCGAGLHTHEEHVEVDSLLSRAELLLRLVWTLS